MNPVPAGEVSDVLLSWAVELQRLCRTHCLDALSATKAGQTLFVTPERVRVAHPERGLVDVLIEDGEAAGLRLEGPGDVTSPLSSNDAADAPRQDGAR